MNTGHIPDELASQLKAYRWVNLLTLEAVAAAVGCSELDVLTIERGEWDRLSVKGHQAAIRLLEQFCGLGAS